MRKSWPLALALLLMGTAAHAECTKDLDCSGEQVCEQGVCEEAEPPPPPVVAKPPRPVGPARVMVVETPSAPKPQTHFEERSPALMVVGSLSAAGGLIGLGVGLLSTHSVCHRELGDDFRFNHCEPPNYLAYTLGGVGLIGGAVLIAVGAKRVPTETVARFSPWLSPRSAGLSMRIEL